MCLASQAGLAGCVASIAEGITQVFHPVLLAWGQHCVLSLCLLPEDLFTAKWNTDLQAPSMAQTYHVVLLPLQPHFCECLLYTLRCWLAVIGLVVHFNLPGSVLAVSVSFAHSCYLFKSSECELLFFTLSLSLSLIILVCQFLSVSLSLSLSFFTTPHLSLYESMSFSLSLSLSLSLCFSLFLSLVPVCQLRVREKLCECGCLCMRV